MNRSTAAENRYSIKRIITGVVIAAICALWLAFQIWLWNSGQYLNISEKIFRFLGLEKNTEWRRGRSVMMYFGTSTSLLFSYFLLVLRPRMSDPKKYWNRARIAVTAVVITLTAALQLLSVPDIYRFLIPKSGVVGSVQNKMYDVIAIANIFVSIAGLLVILIGYIPSLIKRRRYVFRPINIAKGAARYASCILLGTIASITSCFILNIVNVYNSEAVSYISRSGMNDARLVTGLTVTLIMAPIVEEVAFRGIIFGCMKKYMPIWVAMLFSAVCFGLWHRNLGQFCYTLPMAILFAAACHQLGRLRYAIVIHGVNNLIAALVSASHGGGLLPSIKFFGKANKWLMSLPVPVCCVMIVVCIAAIVLIIWKLLPLIAENGNPTDVTI